MSASQRQEFCVRWNSHLGSIGAAFPQLLAGQRFVDVTLACEGHQVHCHRLVLAACSSYFESLLAENPCKHPVIILPSEIKLWEIQALVDFMYKGEVNVTQAGLPQLLRCAEQLRIRGLYGSDAALNLNQLKALTSKAAAAAAAAAAVGSAASAAGTNDSIETDDTTTNSTTTTTTATAASALQQLHAGVGLPTSVHEHLSRKELSTMLYSNGTSHALQQNHHLQQQQQHQHQQQQHHQQQQQQQQLHLQQHQLKQEPHTTNTTSTGTHSNGATEDESADDSTSNAYDQYEKFAPATNPPLAVANMHLDSTIEEDHNYVAHDEDSYGASGDTEHETSANSSALQVSTDAGASFKRVRRSEASLAQAAKCVSKGQTFQTVSNMFNIPVSTIRFYMARKGILPRRKRGRGSSSANSAAAATNAVTAAAAASSLSNAVMSQALAQMKRSGSPLPEPPYHLVGAAGGVGGVPGSVGMPMGAYKLNEQEAAHMI